MMEREILWAWSSDKPDTDNIQLPVSVKLERLFVFVVLTVTLAIFLLAIAPMLGSWSYIVFSIFYILLLPYTLRNYKSASTPKDEQHIILSGDAIDVDYYGHKGVYTLSNIHINTMVVRYVIVSLGGHIGFNKALCFKTRSPRMNIKVPLPVLEPNLSKLENAIKAIKGFSDETAKQSNLNCGSTTTKRP